MVGGGGETFITYWLGWASQVGLQTFSPLHEAIPHIQTRYKTGPLKGHFFNNLHLDQINHLKLIIFQELFIQFQTPFPSH